MQHTVQISKSYYKYWGKAAKEGRSYHILPYHCLDVAAVGQLLLNPKKPLCIALAKQLNVQSEWLHAFFPFCLALHDIGKFSRAFQGIRTDISADLVRPNQRMRYSVRHDSLGFILWRNILSKKNDRHEKRKWVNEFEPWMKIVTGHHGMPPKQSGIDINAFFEKEDEEAAGYFLEEAFNLFLADFDPSPLFDRHFKKRLKAVSWQLAGIAVLADWMGSNTAFFEYYGKKFDLKSYWDTIAIPSAKKASYAMPESPIVSKFISLTDLFPFIHSPTPLQRYAAIEPLNDGPQLFILEDVTGAGKTEAAMVLTHRMLSAGLADGLYVALPTMATANAMYDRLGRVYRRMYNQNSTPSLILAHGARDLSAAFRESVFIAANQPAETTYGEPDSNKLEELSASVYCNAWLADNRKKALLADVGVGTIDQVLLAILPARHQALRLLGLRRKVIVIDEVHAYDSYMQQLLDTLLEAHAGQGGSVILLSATLPHKMRNNLINAFYRGIKQDAPELKNKNYPLATRCPASSDFEKHIDTRIEVKRTVSVTRIATEQAVFEQIEAAVGKGRCVCWIRNTVKATRRSHLELSRKSWMSTDNLHLFHSRFAMIDRQRIEAEVLKRFGNQSCHEDRKGQVLIATQVVEQSLDLDFDVLISDLAPIDLIIQRAGRLCRHIRDADGKRIMNTAAKDQRGMPTLYLFAPAPYSDVDENWLKGHQIGTQAVYPHIGRLWLTAKLLGKGEFSMPQDARSLIEEVYSDEAEQCIPDKLKEVSFTAMGEDQSKKSMGGLNALKISKGYTEKSGEWDEEIRIPTRLTEEESITVTIVQYRDGEIIPYATGGTHPWAMSAVKIPFRDWDKANSKISKDLRNMIEELKNENKFLRWLEIFPLTEETRNYYDPEVGWQPETGEII